jgi:hypothetical protein
MSKIRRRSLEIRSAGWRRILEIILKNNAPFFIGALFF